MCIRDRVEVKLFKTYGLRYGFSKGLQWFSARAVIGLVSQVVLYPFCFGDHIARYETVLDVMALHHGIVEDALFQLFEQFLPADVAEILHICQIDLAELVQRCV